MEPQFELPGGNGHPIAIAAGQLPEPVQASIPGLKPAFDVASALDLIEQAEQDASAAEAEHTRAVLLAKSKRQAADEANAHLRELIRDLNTRRHEARYEVERGDGIPTDSALLGTDAAPASEGSPVPVSASDDSPADVAPEGTVETADVPQAASSSLEPPPPSSPSRRRPRSRRRAQ